MLSQWALQHPSAPGRSASAPTSSRRWLLLVGLACVLTAARLFALPAHALAWDPSSFNSASEQELFSLTNQARASAGLKALKNDSALVSIARWRSKDMIERDYFSHSIPPSGEKVFDVMQQRDYCFKLAGENIGWNNYPDDQATAEIMSMFMASSGHRANIMGAAWDVMGIGAYQGSDGKKMWTVLFADSCSAPAPTATPKPAATPKPTPKPTPKATTQPTAQPTPRPTPRPTTKPTAAATTEPTSEPTTEPTAEPIAEPTSTPEPSPSGLVPDSPSSTDDPAGGAGSGLGPGGQGNGNGNGGDNGNGGNSGGALPPGQSLRISDAPAPQGLLETIVGGVTGFFFGN